MEEGKGDPAGGAPPPPPPTGAHSKRPQATLKERTVEVRETWSDNIHGIDNLTLAINSLDDHVQAGLQEVRNCVGMLRHEKTELVKQVRSLSEVVRETSEQRDQYKEVTERLQQEISNLRDQLEVERKDKEALAERIRDIEDQDERHLENIARSMRSRRLAHTTIAKWRKRVHQRSGSKALQLRVLEEENARLRAELLLCQEAAKQAFLRSANVLNSEAITMFQDAATRRLGGDDEDDDEGGHADRPPSPCSTSTTSSTSSSTSDPHNTPGNGGVEGGDKENLNVGNRERMGREGQRMDRDRDRDRMGRTDRDAQRMDNRDRDRMNRMDRRDRDKERPDTAWDKNEDQDSICNSDHHGVPKHRDPSVIYSSTFRAGDRDYRSQGSSVPPRMTWRRAQDDYEEVVGSGSFSHYVLKPTHQRTHEVPRYRLSSPPPHPPSGFGTGTIPKTRKVKPQASEFLPDALQREARARLQKLQHNRLLRPEPSPSSFEPLRKTKRVMPANTNDRGAKKSCSCLSGPYRCPFCTPIQNSDYGHFKPPKRTGKEDRVKGGGEATNLGVAKVDGKSACKDKKVIYNPDACTVLIEKHVNK